MQELPVHAGAVCASFHCRMRVPRHKVPRIRQPDEALRKPSGCYHEITSARVGLWRSWERASMAWKRSTVRTRPGPPNHPQTKPVLNRIRVSTSRKRSCGVHWESRTRLNPDSSLFWVITACPSGPPVGPPAVALSGIVPEQAHDSFLLLFCELAKLICAREHWM